MTRPTDWSALPLVLHCTDMAQLLGVQVSTIWRRCSERRMVPKPDTWQRPYVWGRDRVRAHYEGHAQPVRRHEPATVAAQTRSVSEVNAALSKALQDRLS